MAAFRRDVAFHAGIPYKQINSDRKRKSIMENGKKEPKKLTDADVIRIGGGLVYEDGTYVENAPAPNVRGPKYHLNVQAGGGTEPKSGLCGTSDEPKVIGGPGVDFDFG